MYKSVEIKEPKGKGLDSIYEEMLKDDDEKRTIDCGSCGYDSCKEMATAIYNGVNTKENCIHYMKELAVREKKDIEEKLSQETKEKEEHEKMLDGVIDDFTSIIEEIGE